MIRTWYAYYLHVKDRLTFNRGFLKGAWVVGKLYTHYKVGKGRRRFSRGEHQPTLAFFPQPAGPWYNIWLVVHNTRLRIVKSVHDADYIFIFDDSTFSNAASDVPPEITAKLINDRITDISKTHVAKVFETVFGYALTIDPTTYVGKSVEKSDENGTHDGELISCPIHPDRVKPGYTYQKFIDSSFSGKTSEDLRIACVFGHVAAVFHKHKAFEKRFGTDYLSTTVRNAVDVFSETERQNIAQFCETIGLDFGAIDIMRDKHDGRIYIVDVNKTCMPVLSLPKEEQHRSLAMIADAFEARLPDINDKSGFEHTVLDNA